MVSVVAGLGNPGRRYEGTRHNLGFDVVDEVARTLGIRFVEGRGEYMMARGSAQHAAVVLIKPTTYMNHSGVAVREVLDQEQVDPGSLIVVYDDFHLPLGMLRLRPGGSDGGHNGMASVLYHLQTDAIRRVRCGIRGEGFPDAAEEIVDYVLSPFHRAELEVKQKLVEHARSSVLAVLGEGFEHAMNTYNGSVC